MKKNIKFIFGIFSVFLLIILLSFTFYKLFSQKMSIVVSNLEVSYPKDGIIIDDSNVSSYVFRIINRGYLRTNYKVILYDNSRDIDGIQRKNLEYELVFNNKVIRYGNLSEISNNVLYSSDIDISLTHFYELRIWPKDNNLRTIEGYQYYLKVVSEEMR